MGSGEASKEHCCDLGLHVQQDLGVNMEKERIYSGVDFRSYSTYEAIGRGSYRGSQVYPLRDSVLGT
jgi:hypothetical protein